MSDELERLVTEQLATLDVDNVALRAERDALRTERDRLREALSDLLDSLPPYWKTKPYLLSSSREDVIRRALAALGEPTGEGDANDTP